MKWKLFIAFMLIFAIKLLAQTSSSVKYTTISSMTVPEGVFVHFWTEEQVEIKEFHIETSFDGSAWTDAGTIIPPKFTVLKADYGIVIHP